MKKMRPYEEIEMWVRNHNLMDKVESYIQKQYNQPLKLRDIYDSLQKRGTAIDIIHISFIFYETDEGFDFWNNINKKFRLWYQHHDETNIRLFELYKLRDALKFEVDYHPEEDDWDEIRKLYFDTLDKIKKLEP